MRSPPRLAVTVGDPCGIGPELVARLLLADPPEAWRDLVFVAPRPALEQACVALGGLPPRWCPPGADADALPAGAVALLDVGWPLPAEAAVPEPGSGNPFPAGSVCRAGGAAAVAAIEEAHRWCAAGRCAGMVTGPIGKEAIRLAGSPFSGHTDMLGALTGVGAEATRMAMVWGKWRVVMTTLHVAWRRVPELLTPASVQETIRLAHVAWATARRPHPAIAVGGLNPHAGEHGLFGEEEARAIVPAIEAIRAVNPRVEGPFPADSLFTPSMRRRFDVFVAQTHDQGLGAIKAFAGLRCVNVTLGLPYVRTSVGHGTAYDIAGQGRADPRGLRAAIREARSLAKKGGRPTLF